MAKVNKKNSAIKLIKWDIFKQVKGSTVEGLYTGNGVHLLAPSAKHIARWWSVTLTLTLNVELKVSDELEVFKCNFRPDAKLTFDDIMLVIADYIDENYSAEQLGRVISGETIAVVCESRPK